MPKEIVIPAVPEQVLTTWKRRLVFKWEHRPAASEEEEDNPENLTEVYMRVGFSDGDEVSVGLRGSNLDLPILTQELKDALSDVIQASTTFRELADGVGEVLLQVDTDVEDSPFEEWKW
jgi:hypothetical protein